MKREEQIGTYDILIQKIRRKRRWVIVLTAILLIAVIGAASPSYFELLGSVILHTKGIHPVLAIVLILLGLILEIIAYAIVSMPLTTSLDTECDPQKYLALNSALAKGDALIPIYAAGLLYMGDIVPAMQYAAQMIASGKQTSVMLGLFYKARCEFLIGDCEAVKRTIQQYEIALSDVKKVKPAHQKMHDTLILLHAIADNDQDKIHAYRNSIQPWRNTKAVEGYINYLKGIAAYQVGDRYECIYRFMAVKEHCEKTVFARVADEYLSRLK